MLYVSLNTSRPPQIAWESGEAGLGIRLERDEEVLAAGSGDSGGQSHEGGWNF